jgi:hypothetical protein
MRKLAERPAKRGLYGGTPGRATTEMEASFQFRSSQLVPPFIRKLLRKSDRTTDSTHVEQSEQSGRVGTVIRQTLDRERAGWFPNSSWAETGRPLDREPCVRTPSHRSRARGTPSIRRSGGKVSHGTGKKPSILLRVGLQPGHPTPPLSEKKQHGTNLIVAGKFRESAAEHQPCLVGRKGKAPGSAVHWKTARVERRESVNGSTQERTHQGRGASNLHRFGFSRTRWVRTDKYFFLSQIN